MDRNYKQACVFGGTGFLGTQVVRELAKAGYVVKVATRVPERAYFLKPCGHVGQVVSVAVDYDDSASIQRAVEGCTCVINLIGILFEKGRSKFQKAHVDIPEKIAKACTIEGVSRYVHVSALGVDQFKSKYGKSKLAGEQAVFQSFQNATILRSCVAFGEGDSFFNMFAKLSRFLPFLPLIGGGKTKFQPVYVGDVADAVMQAIILPAVGDQSPLGKIYELGGPDILTFKEIYHRLFKETGRSRGFIVLPYGIAKIQGVFLSFLPQPPITPDQVESLKTDNIVGDASLTLADLGLNPKSMNTVLPTYLSRYRAGGRFGDKKRA